MNLGGTVHLNRMGVCVVFVCFLIIALYMIRDVEDTEVKKLPTVNIRQVLIAAIELAQKGGDEVVKARKRADMVVLSKGKTKEGANNPVTEADYNSHCVMYFGLKKAFPSLKIISEEELLEGKCGQLSSPELTMQPQPELGLDSLVDEELAVRDLTVWIDPLDATQEFTEKLLEYVTTMVCVAYKGRPLIGVIHRPFGQSLQTSWAWLRHGMSPDLISYKNSGSETAVIVSRSHSGPIVDVVHRALGPDTPIIKAGGAGYKVMQVVSGNASAYIHMTNIKKWDLCAGDAILSAAGGTMTTITSEEIAYAATSGALNTGGVLATLHDHLTYAAHLQKALEKDLNL
uniref:inositol-phosphate phosphatase n=1 Tax=Graphocephala atropunctata TaxID=36148 RepID=A0A1B6L012_9HEMI